MTDSLYKIRDLRKEYGDRVVLADLSFDIFRGESLVIMGRSGCGKSVTLRQLNGLEQPDAGIVDFDGIRISSLPERDLYAVRRRIAMLFQSGALFDSMNVFENIAFPIREHTDATEEEIRHRVAEKLGLVGLDGVEEQMPSALSGGMRKRAALARSLALEPEVLLFDEPSTGLDPMTSASIAHLIRDTQKSMLVTSVVVTHDVALARHVGDRVAFLDGGRFRFLGNWQEAEGSGDQVLADFLAGRREQDHAA